MPCIAAANTGSSCGFSVDGELHTSRTCHKFSKVRDLVYVLYKVDMQRTSRNYCRFQVNVLFVEHRDLLALGADLGDQTCARGMSTWILGREAKRARRTFLFFCGAEAQPVTR